MERMVNQEGLDALVSEELMALRVHEVSLELQDCPEPKALVVSMVLTVQRERLAQLVQGVKLVDLEVLVALDPWVLEVCQAREVVLDPLDLLVVVEMMEQLDLLELLAPPVPLDLLGFLEAKDQRVTQVLLVLVDLMEESVFVERLVPLAQLVLLVLLEFLDMMVQAELKELLVLQVPVVLPASPDLEDLQDPLALWAPLGPKATLENQVCLDSVVRLVPREIQDLLDLLVMLVLLGLQASEETVEKVDLLDLLVLLVQQVMLVLVVLLVLMELLAKGEALESVVDQALLALREMLENLADQENLELLE